MRLRVHHRSHYAYGRLVELGPHIVRLRPAEHTRARVLAYNLDVQPACEVRWQHDPWGNRIARLTFQKDRTTADLTLTVDASLEIRPVNPFDFFVDDRCEKFPLEYPDGQQRELEPFLAKSDAGPRLAVWLRESPPEGYLIDWLVALNRRVAHSVRYIIREDPGIQSAEETLERGQGSCRDSARLLVEALRATGLAARFASGYLVQLADEGNIPDLAKGVAKDVVDLHAWAEAFIPGAGWIGLDGTSGLLCGEGHIPLACTVNPDLAAPVTGTASRPAERFAVTMNIARLGHEPRPRRPYTDEEWAALLAAGRHVDARLAEHGLRLTMGGEPTWTSREHPREPEWTTQALGPTKRAQGLRLARELASRLCNGTLVMRRMGKHYPGESLPRWMIQLLWRTDGVPLWKDPGRLDLTDGPAKGTPLDASLPLKDVAGIAGHLATAIARTLGLESEPIRAHEDPWRFLQDEQNLPDGVDPLTARLDDPEDRRRLARALGQGLGSAVGYALPLGRLKERWVTSRWTFRRDHLFLLPGDAPMGLRLPLDRLRGVPVETEPRDVTAIVEPIAFDPRQRREQRRAQGPETFGSLVIQPTGHVGGLVRTALCVEPRDGVLHVFLPPLPRLEDFLELVAVVEACAADMDLAVGIEGYAPGNDARLRSCVIAPDPGVIEVNLPVTGTFDDYVRTLETVAQAANQAGLSTEKYQLDGREVGSGGGNHLTLGGPTTVESPFLGRPDLLASLLRYFQNHPSLSFLFTGLFVGPTSQAPRIDEARMDILDELEIALDRLAAPDLQRTFPWFTDRLLRNILVDVAGSTHRTEICIDKLYSPAGPAGRQGIIELRAFEMPPHERMAAAQMLLVRALTAMFAKAPCTRPLIRWGKELHDRFLLPHYLWADLESIVADLRSAGLDLEPAWFRPFLDIRFPVFGTLNLDDIVLEVRGALEPWPVLGEEPTGSTVSRYVDSSVERVQVKVDGITQGRHVVLVNGTVLPMRPTGRASERVAGVRFRAWQPPHCLHPMIGVQHPLRFDVVDTWAARSLGACTYHVWHPDGRAFDEPPLTAFEAAARRAQRFTTQGHSPWPVRSIPASPHPDQPYTLDLRRHVKDESKS